MHFEINMNQANSNAEQVIYEIEQLQEKGNNQIKNIKQKIKYLQETIEEDGHYSVERNYFHWFAIALLLVAIVVNSVWRLDF